MPIVVSPRDLVIRPDLSDINWSNISLVCVIRGWKPQRRVFLKQGLFIKHTAVEQIRQVFGVKVLFVSPN